MSEVIKTIIFIVIFLGFIISKPSGTSKVIGIITILYSLSVIFGSEASLYPRTVPNTAERIALVLIILFTIFAIITTSISTKIKLLSLSTSSLGSWSCLAIVAFFLCAYGVLPPFVSIILGIAGFGVTMAVFLSDGNCDGDGDSIC